MIGCEDNNYAKEDFSDSGFGDLNLGKLPGKKPIGKSKFRKITEDIDGEKSDSSSSFFDDYTEEMEIDQIYKDMALKSIINSYEYEIELH